jgi:gliding motility-associated-like protein
LKSDDEWKLVFVSVNRLRTTTTLTIIVKPIVTPIFSSLPSFCSGTSINPLPTTSINGIKGTWFPFLNNLKTTTYLFTPTSDQCATTTDLIINIINSQDALFVPNAFTPDGDGLNDIFLPYYNGVTNYNMKIVNRWGEIIFETNDLAIGWDGRNKGEISQDGVYSWIITYRTICNDKTNLQKFGTVMILR